MPITISVDQPNNLTTFIVDGPIYLAEIQAAIKRFYENTNPPPSKHILWDLRNASVDKLRSDEAVQLANYAANFDKRKEIGKTAIVASSDVVFGVSRIFEAHVINPSIKLNVFRDVDEAREWLEIESE
jgi:hypothetical protein